MKKTSRKRLNPLQRKLLTTYDTYQAQQERCLKTYRRMEARKEAYIPVTKVQQLANLECIKCIKACFQALDESLWSIEEKETIRTHIAELSAQLVLAIDFDKALIKIYNELHEQSYYKQIAYYKNTYLGDIEKALLQGYGNKLQLPAVQVRSYSGFMRYRHRLLNAVEIAKDDLEKLNTLLNDMKTVSDEAALYYPKLDEATLTSQIAQIDRLSDVELNNIGQQMSQLILDLDHVFNDITAHPRYAEFHAVGNASNKVFERYITQQIDLERSRYMHLHKAQELVKQQANAQDIIQLLSEVQ